MKTMRSIKMMLIAVMMTIVTSASAMTYSQAKDQALFLADKMAYELNLTDEQYEAAYEINLDYLMAVNDYNDLYGYYWTLRNEELQSILSSWQYNAYVAATYFYRPVYRSNNSWVWRIYTRYAPTKFYEPRPKVYVTYRGGNNRNFYTSRTWNVPSRPNTTARRVVMNNNRNNNVGNRTFGNLTNDRVSFSCNNTRTVNILNNRTINIQNNRQTSQSRPTMQSMSNNRTFGNRQSDSTFGNHQATTSFGAHQTSAPAKMVASNGNTSGKFGRR